MKLRDEDAIESVKDNLKDLIESTVQPDIKRLYKKYTIINLTKENRMIKYVDLPAKNVASIENVTEIVTNAINESLSQKPDEDLIAVVTITAKVDEERCDKDSEYSKRIDPDNYGWNRINTSCYRVFHRSMNVTGSNYTTCFEALCNFQVLCDERRTVTNYENKKLEYSCIYTTVENIVQNIVSKHATSDYDADMVLMSVNDFVTNISEVEHRLVRQSYESINENNLLHYNGF